jgi:transmembrane sensor
MKEDITEDLLIRYVLGEVSESEIKEITNWVNASDSNARQFEQTKFILETSQNLAKQSPLTESDAWARFNEKRDTQSQTILKPSFGFNYWVRIAATVLVFLGAAWAGYFIFKPKNDLPQFVTLTSKDKVLTDTLPDGSVIHLNKHSSVTYAVKFKENRQVKLKGEAFFDVAHDEKVPFSVNVNDVSIHDVGTSFNISSNTKRVEIIVENGIVEVRRRNKTLQLHKSEMVTINATDNELQKVATKDQLYNYYLTNSFVADNTPLYRLVEMLNQAYNSSIIIESKETANAPITGTFPASSSVEEILQVVLATTPEIHMSKVNGQIRLR